MAFRQKSLRKISLFVLFVVLLAAVCEKLKAQQPKTWQPHYWQSLEKYRNKVVAKTFEQDSAFKEVFYRWKSVEKDTDTFCSMLVECSWEYKVFKTPFAIIKLEAGSNYPNSQIRKIYTKSDLDVLSQHIDLIDLINWGLVESEFPYKIKRKYELIRQLDFLHLIPGEIVADIGAGNGMFAQLISMMGIKLKIYMTEIDGSIVHYLKDKLKQDVHNEMEAEVVKGLDYETNLPEKVDKIILRNTFHHFSEEEMMLSSIKQSLKPDGRLFVYESIYKSDATDNCKKELTEPEIRNPIKKAGFHLIRRLMIDGFVLLEYSL